MTDLFAIGAHPDDVELSCGGWIASAARRGYRVELLDLTAGEAGTNGDAPTRAAEAAAAAAILGVAARHNAGLPDTGVDARDPAHVDAVVAHLRAARPRLVLAPHDVDRHPDHVEASRLVHRALFLAGLAKHRPDLGPAHRADRLLTYPQRQEVRPDLVVDITAVADLKRAAIAAHASQFGGAPTLLNSAVGFAAWEHRDRYWGSSIGVELAEPYLLDAPVPISDPVDHFRRHPARPARVPAR